MIGVELVIRKAPARANHNVLLVAEVKRRACQGGGCVMGPRVRG